MSLGADAVAWSVAYYNLMSGWSFILALLSVANVGSILLPFLYAMKRRKRFQEATLRDVLITLVLFWALNLIVAVQAYFGFCSSCYFG